MSELQKRGGRATLFLELRWLGMPRVLFCKFRRREVWFLRSQMSSRSSSWVLQVLGARQMDFDRLPRVDVGGLGAGGPMKRALDRLDALDVDRRAAHFAQRYEDSSMAAGMFRSAVIRSVATNLFEAYYAELWADNLGYGDVNFVASSLHDKLMLEREDGRRVSGRLTVLVVSALDLMASWFRRFSGRRRSKAVAVRACSSGVAEAPPADEADLSTRQVAFILNNGGSYGRLFTYGQMLSRDPESPLHPQRVRVIARESGLHSVGASWEPYPRPGHPLAIGARTLWLFFGAILRLGPRASGVVWRLSRVQSVAEGLTSRLKSDFSSVRMAVVAYDLQVDISLLLAFERVGVVSVAVNERPLSVVASYQPFCMTDLLTASEFFAEAARHSRVVHVRRAVPVGMWRTDLLREYGRGEPHDFRQQATQGGQRLVVVLPFHLDRTYARGSDPLATEVAPLWHFLAGILLIARSRPDLLFVIRGKNLDWTENDSLSELLIDIESQANVLISREYTQFNESYKLCAHADLVIAQYTSMVDEALAVGIPCVVHDFNSNCPQVTRPLVPYLPDGIWANSDTELMERITFALLEGGDTFRAWWEPHRLRIYGDWSDGNVRARACDYMEALLLGRSWESSTPKP